MDSIKKSKIKSLKDRMLKIKKAAKKCKRFVQKCEKKKGIVGGGSGEQTQKVKELFLDSQKMAQNCQNELKSSNLGPHIENYRQLLDKMKKYERRFAEGARVIDKYNPIDDKSKFKSCVLFHQPTDISNSLMIEGNSHTDQKSKRHSDNQNGGE